MEIRVNINVWAIVRPFDNRKWADGVCRHDVARDRRAVCRLLAANEEQLVVVARVLRRHNDLSESDVNRLIKWACNDHSMPVTRHDAYNGIVSY